MGTDEKPAFLESLRTALTVNFAGQESDPQRTSILFPGLPVSSLFDSDGKANQNLYRFADVVPTPSPIYGDSGYKVSTEYRKITNASLPRQQAGSEEEQAQINAALDQMRQTSKAYYEAMLSIEALRTQRDKLRKQRQQPELQRAYQEQIKELNRQYGDVLRIYESQRDIVRQFTQRTGPAQAFRTAEQLMNLCQTEQGLMEIQCLPSRWLAQEGWTDISLAGTLQTQELCSSMQEPKALRGQEKTAQYSITFQAKAIWLLRDWLDMSLLQYPQAVIQGYAKGTISTGTSTGNGTMQWIAQRLIAVQGLAVATSLTTQELRCSSESNAVSFGPFLIDETKILEEVTEKTNRTNLKSEQPQIIAVQSKLCPAFPLADN